jgi:hypothetical protein
MVDQVRAFRCGGDTRHLVSDEGTGRRESVVLRNVNALLQGFEPRLCPQAVECGLYSETHDSADVLVNSLL